MAIHKREWSATDIATVEYFKKQKEQKSLTFQELGSKTGITLARLKTIFYQTSAPPTLDEFVRFCKAFGIKPSETLDKIMNRSIEQMQENTYDERIQQILSDLYSAIKSRND